MWRNEGKEGEGGLGSCRILRARREGSGCLRCPWDPIPGRGDPGICPGIPGTLPGFPGAGWAQGGSRAPFDNDTIKIPIKPLEGEALTQHQLLDQHLEGDFRAFPWDFPNPCSFWEGKGLSHLLRVSPSQVTSPGGSKNPHWGFPLALWGRTCFPPHSRPIPTPFPPHSRPIPVAIPAPEGCRCLSWRPTQELWLPQPQNPAGSLLLLG